MATREKPLQTVNKKSTHTQKGGVQGTGTVSPPVRWLRGERVTVNRSPSGGTSYTQRRRPTIRIMSLAVQGSPVNATRPSVPENFALLRPGIDPHRRWSTKKIKSDARPSPRAASSSEAGDARARGAAARARAREPLAEAKFPKCKGHRMVLKTVRREIY